jgi:hypothetical protein
MDYQKRKNQKKTTESKWLEMIQKAFKEATDKSILHCRTASVESVREELLKQGFWIMSIEDKKENPDDHLYYSNVDGAIEINLYPNKKNNYYVWYSEVRDRKEDPCKYKIFKFIPGYLQTDTVTWSDKDTIDRLTPLPLGIKMGDSRETVQKKLGLTENMRTVISGNFIDSRSIHIQFEKESYQLLFDGITMRLNSYTVKFTN